MLFFYSKSPIQLFLLMDIHRIVHYKLFLVKFGQSDLIRQLVDLLTTFFDDTIQADTLIVKGWIDNALTRPLTLFVWGSITLITIDTPVQFDFASLPVKVLSQLLVDLT